MTTQIDKAWNDFVRGQRLEQGLACTSDLELAAAFYRRAALRGLPEAQHALAFLHATGQGVERHEQLAVSWFEIAAAHGHVSAQHNLAVMLAEGRGVERDEQAAVRWFYHAALGGSLEARTWLEGNGRASLAAKTKESFALEN